MPGTATHDTHAKALAINLDPSTYGSFAEIGGGQEIARWFLSVGAASGTVAQTISAYDKAFSDHTYGVGTRYVSRERLETMLAHEYGLLLDRLAPERGPHTRFFALANTVATRNYHGDNEQHGWIGLRFQTTPGGQPNDVLLHVNLRDPAARLQQNALGILGVNLLYAAYYARESCEQFLDCLADNLPCDRVEIDVLDFAGDAFYGCDPRSWSIQLLRRNMACAILFDMDFRVVEPSSALRKRPLLIERGTFGSVEPFHAAMLDSARRSLAGEGLPLGREPQSVLELSLEGGAAAAAAGNGRGDDAPDDRTVLARIPRLLDLAPVLVTDIAEGHRLVPYLRRYTTEPIRLVSGVPDVARILQARFYRNVPFSVLEGLGRMFANNVKFYVYPMPKRSVSDALASDPDSAGEISIADSPATLVGADELLLSPPFNHLYRFLRETGWVVPIGTA